MQRFKGNSGEPTRASGQRSASGSARAAGPVRGAQVTALDAAPTLLAVARERVPGADVREGDLEAVPFADASFDAVPCRSPVR